jgi:ATP/maltotriose-dependent transcriptional regulator MalT
MAAPPVPAREAGALLHAGRAALATGDWATARQAFAAALELDASPAAYEGLGMACRWLVEPEPALRALRRAYRGHRDAGDPRGAARVALQLCLGEAFFHGDADMARGWAARAGRLLDGLDPGAEHAWLLLVRAHLAFAVEADPAASRALAAEARAAAREAGELDPEMMALGLEGLLLVSDGQVREGMRRLDEATAAAVAGDLREPDAISTTCCYLIDACKRVGDYERAARWCEQVERICEEWSDKLTFAACRAHYADILIWRGAWADAEAELQAALGPLGQINPGRLADGLVRLAEIRRRQGRRDEAASLLEAAEGHRLAPLVRAALSLDRGDAAAAADEAERALRRVPPGSAVDRGPALELVVRARLAAGEPDAAQAAAAELRGIADRVGTDAAAAAAALAGGLVAGAAGRWDEARTAFEDGVDHYARAGGRWEAAMARRELARALRALGRHEAAEREARTADAALRRLGAAAGQPPDGPAPAGLTRREVEVLRLIARGRANPEIAAELVLSVRTVERHVANIYEKIGASGRAARATAASYALATGVA